MWASVWVPVRDDGGAVYRLTVCKQPCAAQRLRVRKSDREASLSEQLAHVRPPEFNVACGLYGLQDYFT